MSGEKSFFEQNITSLHNLTSIYQYINRNATLMDADHLLRAEYVLIVSAFDNYIHHIVRRKIRESFFDGLPVTSELCMPTNIFQTIHNETNPKVQQNIFDAALRKTLEKDSYQSPRSIEYALNLIGINHIWTAVSSIMGVKPKHVKMQLSLIVKRRNQIAHEADIDYSIDSCRSIDELTVMECHKFLKKLVKGIDALII